MYGTSQNYIFQTIGKFFKVSCYLEACSINDYHCGVLIDCFSDWIESL
jgi:hypothetical protein